MTQQSPSTPPIVVAAGAATDTGKRRDHNEDSFLCAAPLFLVADGMGGYEAGELASAAAIGAFAGLEGQDAVTIAELKAAYRSAGDNVMAIGSGGRTSAGTTLSGVAIAENQGAGYWLVINVGDSRTYRFAQGKLEQVSVDHSLVQEMVDAGDLRAEDAGRHAERNVVTRALGAGGVSEPDFWMLPAAAGDRIVVCSDGLSGELGVETMQAILGSTSDPAAAAQLLVAAAVDHGGRDNVTVVVVDAVSVAPTGGDVDEDTVPRQREVV